MTLFGTIDTSLYEEQIRDKVRTLVAEMRNIVSIPEPEVFTSDPVHYRMRAEFLVFHEGERLRFCMTDVSDGVKKRVFIDHFDPGSELMNFFMPLIADLISGNPVLQKRLFDIDFLTSLSGQTLITLTYHKKLTVEWESAARELLRKLRETGRHVNLIGRAAKQKIVMDEDFVWETLKVNGKEFHYQQVDNSFTQPNGHVAEKMLSWVQNITRGIPGDLLELYCGNGNFSIALAENFEKVLATEISKTSVKSAQLNIARNNVANLKILRMSAEEFTEAMNKVRSFRRLEESGVDLDSYECHTVLVDPPRAGLDEGTLKMIQKYDHIVYVSCNPATLMENLRILSETHGVEKLAFFDQFPYTPHVETVVLLSREKQNG